MRPFPGYDLEDEPPGWHEAGVDIYHKNWINSLACCLSSKGDQAGESSDALGRAFSCPASVTVHRKALAGVKLRDRLGGGNHAPTQFGSTGGWLSGMLQPDIMLSPFRWLVFLQLPACPEQASGDWGRQWMASCCSLACLF